MDRRIGKSALTILVFLIGVCSGCNGPTEPGKVPPPPPPPLPLALTALSPTNGPSVGGTTVALRGTGFVNGVSATMGGMTVTVNVVDSKTILLTTPPHEPGAVEVVLTSASGEVSRLDPAFTYVFIPPPVVEVLEPTTLSTRGTSLQIKGTGFGPGTQVFIDGLAATANYYPNIQGILFASAPAHAEGVVDVVVTNPGGQSVRIPAALTYVRPESFDLNGEWLGDADNGFHEGIVITFTIENNVMVSLSCGTGLAILPEPKPTIVAGQIVLAAGTITGQVISEGQMSGTIKIAPCGNHVWSAGKK